MAAIAQQFRNKPETLCLVGGISGALAAWMWTTTPISGGFLFGATSLFVYITVYEGLNILGDSRIAQLTRFALGVLAGAAAGAAVVSTLMGFTLTIEAAGTLSIAMVITLICVGIDAHQQRQQQGAAPQPQRV